MGRHKWLDTDTAHHSYLMKPAEEPLINKWNELELNDTLKCDVYLNGNGDIFEQKNNENDIGHLMAKQLYSDVCWYQSITNYMQNNQEDEESQYYFIELGPRNVCQKLIQQILSYHHYEKTNRVEIMSIGSSKSVHQIESIL